jgi:hypothetical protein
MLVNIESLLRDAGHQLCSFLEKILPQISSTWWSDCVLNILSISQQRAVAQKKISTLTGLDLAALLRVLDQNWYAISDLKNFSTEARHFVKEMATIRNRWAHVSVKEFSQDDNYRDLDTLQRFASVIEADISFIEKVRVAKSKLISPEPGKGQMPQVTADQVDAEPTEFQIGEIVFPKANPALKGVVIGINPGKTENRYAVFYDNNTFSYYASQLQALEESAAEVEILPINQFHAHLTALQIQHPGLSTLYSLNAARINFIPYQFRPVLKFIRSDRPRLLIADSVGVGKTIEAGLILRELQARRDIKSVLIICPKPLIVEQKWEMEMKRFDERFTPLDGPKLRYCLREMDLDGVWPEQHHKAILPYSLFDETLLYGSKSKGRKGRPKGLVELDPPPRFDLVIVDEAARLRNTNTFTHEGVRFFCENAEAVLFLTATPIQLGSDDLFVLLNILRPDLIIDRESFEHMSAPNPYLNRAITLIRSQIADWQAEARIKLLQAAATPWGLAILKKNPEFNRCLEMLGQKEITPEDRISCVNTLEQLHTFAGIINRTRRRDIGDFTIRKPETVTVDFTPPQKHFHDNLLQIQALILSRLQGDRNVKFMMTTIRRQAASCLPGLVPLLQDILTRRLNELPMEEADDSYDSLDIQTVDKIEPQIRQVLAQAENLDPFDPKLAALAKIIKDKQARLNNKVMLFSSFRHTLSYLFRHLNTQDFRVGMIHGDIPDEERLALRQRFELPRENPDALDIMLFSEVGCEGLDYQFCDCLVNYDLPWNPMRIEQRIGRIDRNGQRSESIAIYNLVTPGTVDADIYERCLLRIGVFNHALGECEDILGQITQEVHDVADNFALSPEERQTQLQQIADNKIRLLQEQQKLEENQAELFGIRLPTEQIRQDIENSSSYWLRPSALQNLLKHYLKAVCGPEQEYILGDKPLKTLRLSQEARNRLLLDFQALPRQTSIGSRDWEAWLKGGNPHLQITLESACAMETPSASFITPIHPWVRQAARSCEDNQRLMTAFRAKDNSIAPGEYPFAIYQWQFQGIREDLILQPVCQHEDIAQHFFRLLENGDPLSLEPAKLPPQSVFDRLDSHHYIQWAAARQEHIGHTSQLSAYRRESLKTSHQARLALLQEQLSQANNEKIRRMRQSQISNAEADFARRIQEIDIAMERADVIAQPVAFGVIRVFSGGQ